MPGESYRRPLMPDKSYRRRLWSSVLCLCDFIRALILHKRSGPGSVSNDTTMVSTPRTRFHGRKVSVLQRCKFYVRGAGIARR